MDLEKIEYDNLKTIKQAEQTIKTISGKENRFTNNPLCKTADGCQDKINKLETEFVNLKRPVDQYLDCLQLTYALYAFQKLQKTEMKYSLKDLEAPKDHLKTDARKWVNDRVNSRYQAIV